MMARTVTAPVPGSTIGAISLTRAVMCRSGKSIPDRVTGAPIASRSIGESGVRNTASRPVAEASETTACAAPTIWPGSAMRAVTMASLGAWITVSASALSA